MTKNSKEEKEKGLGIPTLYQFFLPRPGRERMEEANGSFGVFHSSLFLPLLLVTVIVCSCGVTHRG